MGIDYVQLVRDSWAARMREFEASPFGQGTGLRFFEAHEVPRLPSYELKLIKRRIGYFAYGGNIEVLITHDFAFGTSHGASNGPSAHDSVETALLVLANTDVATSDKVECDGSDELFKRYVANFIAQGVVFDDPILLSRRADKAAEARTLVDRITGHVFDDPKGRKYYTVVASIPYENITPDVIERRQDEDNMTVGGAVYELALWPLVLWFHGTSRNRVIGSARAYNPRIRTRVQ